MYQNKIKVSWPKAGPATFRALLFCNLTTKSPIKFTADSPRPTLATRRDLDTALSNLKCVIHRGNVDIGAWSPWFETLLTKPSFVMSKQTALSFMEGVIDPHMDKKSNYNQTGTIVKSGSHATNWSSLLQSKSVSKLPLETRSEIYCAPANINISIVMKADFEAIV